MTVFRDVFLSTLGGGGGDVSQFYPQVTSNPVVSSADSFEGTTASCTQGTWDNASTYAYQWQRDGVNISGATSNTYVLDAADVGSTVTCNVTATNFVGNTTVTATGSIVVEANAIPALEAPVETSDTKAQHVYGVYRIVEDYAGNTLRAKRLSDNLEEDFNFNASTGIFDIDAVFAWAAGADVDVVKFYDQKGSINVNVIGKATLIVSGVVKRFGTDVDPADNQLIRLGNDGGIGVDLGGVSYLQAEAHTNFDTTGGFEVTYFHSPNERKVGSGAVATDPFGGNNDQETLFDLVATSDSLKRMRNIVGAGSAVDFATVNNTNSIRTYNGNTLPYKQYGQSIVSYSANASTFDIYKYGQKLSVAHNADVITDIGNGVFNTVNINIGISGTTQPNILFGGFILSKPYTALERYKVHSKLSLIGQEHQRVSNNDLLALFDEIVLFKNIDPVTGEVVGEKGKLTLNFETGTNAAGTADFDFAYSHPTVGIQGVRSPTQNLANSFIATDNYFAETHTGSIATINIPDATHSDLYMVFSQTNTVNPFDNNSNELSLGIGCTHNQYNTRLQIAYSLADGNSLINNRHKADETPWGYDGSNADMGKYNRNLSSVQFNYDELYDGHVWDKASWENQSPTQPYLLDAPVFPPNADNIQFAGKQQNQFIMQFATFEKGENYNFADPWATRKQYRLTGKGRMYLSDGTSPVGHRDGSISKSDHAANVHSTPNAKIMSVTSNTITALPYHGTQFAMIFAKTVWTQDQVEKIRSNMYKLLV